MRRANGRLLTDPDKRPLIRSRIAIPRYATLIAVALRVTLTAIGHQRPPVASATLARICATLRAAPNAATREGPISFNPATP